MTPVTECKAQSGVWLFCIQGFCGPQKCLTEFLKFWLPSLALRTRLSLYEHMLMRTMNMYSRFFLTDWVFCCLITISYFRKTDEKILLYQYFLYSDNGLSQAKSIRSYLLCTSIEIRCPIRLLLLKHVTVVFLARTIPLLHKMRIFEKKKYNISFTWFSSFICILTDDLFRKRYKSKCSLAQKKLFEVGNIKV